MCSAFPVLWNLASQLMPFPGFSYIQYHKGILWGLIKKILNSSNPYYVYVLVLHWLNSVSLIFSNYPDIFGIFDQILSFEVFKIQVSFIPTLKTCSVELSFCERIYSMFISTEYMYSFSFYILCNISSKDEKTTLVYSRILNSVSLRLCNGCNRKKIKL